MLLKSVFVSLALASVLAACDAPGKSSASDNRPSPTRAAAASLDVLKQQAKGFAVGAQDGHEVFVFFDPQCPHCATLWTETKSVLGRVKMTWLPVGILRSASVTQGAAILQSANPVDAMDAHAHMVAQGRIGAPDAVVSTEARAALEQNTQLFKSFAAEGVPLIVTRHVVTGKQIAVAGGMSADALITLVGLTEESAAKKAN